MARDKNDRLNKQRASDLDDAEVIADQKVNQSNDNLDEDQESNLELSKEDKENKNTRMNAAKAFYRTMVEQEGSNPVADSFPSVDNQSNFTVDSQVCACPNCENLGQQLLEAQTKATEFENLYKRMAADFDNFRKRTEREKEELLSMGVQKAIEAILPAVDDLDRAQANLTPESDPRSIIESLRLIYNRINQCLAQLGIQPMEALGQPFDPKLHEPVQQIQTEELPDGHVVHDLRRGYLMKDRVIRPALVNVSTGILDSADAQEEEDEQSQASQEVQDI